MSDKRENYLLAKIERLEEDNKILLEEIQEGCNRCTEDCSQTPFSEKYRELEQQNTQLQADKDFMIEEHNKIVQQKAELMEFIEYISDIAEKDIPATNKIHYIKKKIAYDLRKYK